MSGLTNGTAYTFTVSATNAIGTGPASAPSNPVTPAAFSCAACTIWPSSTTPSTPDEGDTSSVEVGVKFKSDLNGVIKGIRFYKGAANTGTHIGNLWSATGTKLASATFSSETASGWQQVNFATPVSITANTVYVASYFAPAGHYAGDGGYFAASGVDNVPLHALADGVSGGNGVYTYGSASVFPNLTFNSENYWVDVVFSTGAATAPAAPTGVTATAGAGSAQVSWTAPSDGGSAITSYTVTPFIGTTAQTPTTVTGTPPATSTTVSGLTNGTAYTFTVTATNAVGTGPASTASNPVTPTAPTAPAAPTGVTATAGAGSAQVSWTASSTGGSPITSYTVTPFIGATAQTPITVTGTPPATSTTVSGLTNGTAYTFTVSATNAIGTGPASAPSNPVTPAAFSCAACTIWPSSTTPSTPDEGDTSSVEVGVKFKSDLNGVIKGIRFYKGAANTGTHIGNLWSATGTKLASATFSSETASGWQQVNFATPVSITANTVYVASYFAPAGHYAGDGGYFAASGVDNVPLHALADGVSGGNGVYTYGSASGFPNLTFNSENYWVDVVFSTGAATAPAAPTGVTATAGDGSAQVSWTAPSDGGSAITSYTVTPFIGATAQTPVTVTGTPPATSTTVTGLTNGTAYTFTVTATNAVGTGPASAASNPVTPTAPTAPAAPTGVTATAGAGSAQVSWTAPLERRQRDHQLHGHPVHRDDRTDTGHRDRKPTGDHHHGHRADQRHRLHLHGVRHQRDRHRPRLRPVEPGHPDRTDRARGADRRDRDGRQRVGGGDLDRAVERRQRDHQLHGDPVHRDDRTDTDHRDRKPTGDHHHGHRADQRHRLHLHGDRHQRHRHRARLRPVERGHPGGADRSWGADRRDRDGRATRRRW